MFIRAIATGMVGPFQPDHFLRQQPHFFQYLCMNLAARPADQLAAMRPQLTELEIDSLKVMLPSLQSAKVS